MTDYAAIYESRAAQYERLIAREDHEGHVLPAIAAVRPLAGIDVVELGAGTGRLARLLAPHVGSIRAFDASPAMLEVAREVLTQGGFTNWHLEVADHRRLPAADGSADLAIGGWTICYAALWSKGEWEADLDAVLAEMGRVLRPGGAIVILETLGTGHESPHPPAELEPYFARLAALGFEQTWIRTDYRFASPEEAVELTRFFFGDALAERLAESGSTVLPECTGVWWRAPATRARAPAE
jgi:ubiquinone/menaquinone biosynthesis C-methylase UbiE